MAEQRFMSGRIAELAGYFDRNFKFCLRWTRFAPGGFANQGTLRSSPNVTSISGMEGFLLRFAIFGDLALFWDMVFSRSMCCPSL
jgi:hypothetical protein